MGVYRARGCAGLITYPLMNSAREFHPHDIARANALAGTPLASFKARLAAFGLDFGLAAILYIPLEMARQYLFQRLRGVHEIEIHVHVDFHNPGSLIWMVLYFGLSVFWSNGSTLGKRLMKIRVVSLVSERISLWQSIERALGYGASMLEGGFGFFQYFIHHNHCCVHDRIAETIVVKDLAKVR
jgi:uncharacterized RDD family membrane protein YckC